MKNIFLQGTQQESKHNTIYESKWCVQCTHQKQNALSLFKDKAQALQSSCCSAGTENRSSSPVVEPFNPLTPPSSTKKPVVLMID